MQLPKIQPILFRKPRDTRMVGGVELVEDYKASDGECITCGFEWDGATIPRVFWSIVGSPYDPEVIIPSLEHDYDYWTRKYDRDLCDDRFYHNMIRCGVGKKRAYTMYKAVRNFGGCYYERRQQDIDYAISLYHYIAGVYNSNFLTTPELPFLKYFPELPV